MLDFLKKKTEINTTQIVDEIEATVYEHIKPYGFKKHGRTLHRFVSEDISQVIHFQSGMPSHGMSGLLCVNLGIRIPECSERTFQPQAEKKKYYHEYECTIRSRLGIVSGKQDTWYDLHKKTDKITCFFEFIYNPSESIRIIFIVILVIETMRTCRFTSDNI